MLSFTLICILIILVLLLITAPGIWFLYRYTRPKTGPIKTMLIWEAGLVSLLFIGTIISALWPQGCVHPTPALSSGRPKCVSGSIALGGSTALQSLMKRVADSYTKQCATEQITTQINVIDSTNPDINKSEDGLDRVEDGSIDIGTSDTFATPDKSDLVDHEIAASVFVVIVNIGVQVTNLTVSQIQGIYAGKYKNWQELGGPNLTINALSRGSGSGTRYTFDKYILGANELVRQPSAIPDTAHMIASVQKTPGAIGYADLHDVSANLSSLIPLSIDGVIASPATAISGNYKFWTVEHMYTKGAATGLTQAFIDYFGNNNTTQIMQSFSFIDMHTMTSSALSTRCS